MSEQPFRDPRLALNRIYTRTGDQGDTSLASGERVPKDAPRIECYGTVDELNAFAGLAAVTAREASPACPALLEIERILVRIQQELFNLGSNLSTLPGSVHPRQPRVGGAEVEQLEAEMDRMNHELAELRSFVLPGGSRLAAELHICRTVCRRAERRLIALSRHGGVDQVNIRYLNRLSDAFFVFSRWANLKLGRAEVLWAPNQAASAQPR
jgi:cob(I)alamin adenosyltransferase